MLKYSAWILQGIALVMLIGSCTKPEKPSALEKFTGDWTFTTLRVMNNGDDSIPFSDTITYRGTIEQTAVEGKLLINYTRIYSTIIGVNEDGTFFELPCSYCYGSFFGSDSLELYLGTEISYHRINAKKEMNK